MNFLWKKFIHFPQSGFSMMELLISVGLVGMVALGGIELLTNQNGIKNYVNTRYEETEILQGMSERLSDISLCTANLKGLQSGDVLTSGIELTSGAPIFPIGVAIPNHKIQIERLTLIEKSAPSRPGAGVFTLEVDFRRIKKGPGAKISKREIMILANLDASGTITSCLGDPAQTKDRFLSEHCLSIGGVYNPGNQKCNLSPDFNKEHWHSVSKFYLNRQVQISTEEAINEMRAEIDRDYIRKDVAMLCPAGKAPKSIINGQPICVDAITAAPPTTPTLVCSGSNSRLVYKSENPWPFACRSKTQTRICSNGKWGSWRPTFPGYNYTKCKSSLFGSTP